MNISPPGHRVYPLMRRRGTIIKRLLMEKEKLKVGDYVFSPYVRLEDGDAGLLVVTEIRKDDFVSVSPIELTTRKCINKVGVHVKGVIKIPDVFKKCNELAKQLCTLFDECYWMGYEFALDENRSAKQSETKTTEIHISIK